MTTYNGRDVAAFVPEDQKKKAKADQTAYVLHPPTIYNKSLFEQCVSRELAGGYAPTNLELLDEVEKAVPALVPKRKQKALTELLARRRATLEAGESNTEEDERKFTELCSGIYNDAPAVAHILNMRVAYQNTLVSVACDVFLAGWRNVPDAENPVEFAKKYGVLKPGLLQQIPAEHQSEIYAEILARSAVGEEDAKN
ncbi:MAG: hypothetical protein MI806_07335 [Minwuiales bacterium]|nr:hypothetical protein [Minwuiales bacterium]